MSIVHHSAPVVTRPFCSSVRQHEQISHAPTSRSTHDANRADGPPGIVSHAGIIANEAQLRQPPGRRALGGRAAIIRFHLEDSPVRSGEARKKIECRIDVGWRGPGEAGQSLAVRLDDQDRTAARSTRIIARRRGQPRDAAVQQFDVQRARPRRCSPDRSCRPRPGRSEVTAAESPPASRVRQPVRRSGDRFAAAAGRARSGSAAEHTARRKAPRRNNRGAARRAIPPRQERSELAPGRGRRLQRDDLAREHAVPLEQHRGPREQPRPRRRLRRQQTRPSPFRGEPTALAAADRSDSSPPRATRGLGKCARVDSRPGRDRVEPVVGHQAPSHQLAAAPAHPRRLDARQPRQIGREARTVPRPAARAPSARRPSSSVGADPVPGSPGNRGGRRRRAARRRPCPSHARARRRWPDLVEPGRPVALDPPRQDLVLPRGGRRREALSCSSTARRTPAPRPRRRMNVLPPQAENRRRPRARPPGSRGAAPPRSPGASRPGSPAPPIATRRASHRSPIRTTLPSSDQRSSSSAASTGAIGYRAVRSARPIRA